MIDFVMAYSSLLREKNRCGFVTFFEVKPMLMFSMHILLPKQSNFKNIRAI